MDSVPVLLFVGGNVIIGHHTVKYSTTALRATRIPRSINLHELKEIVYRLTNIESSKFNLKLSTKYSYMDKSHCVEVHLDINDDNNLQFMLDSINEMRCIELYIEKDFIEHNVDVEVPESYIPCITEGFDSMGFHDEAGTSAAAFFEPIDENRFNSHDWTGGWDRYITDTVEENVSWPISARGWDSGARGWYSVDTNPVGLDCSPSAGSGHGLTPVVHDEQRSRELSLDVHLHATEIFTEPDTTTSEIDEDEHEDGNATFADIGPSHTNTSDHMHAYPFENISNLEHRPDALLFFVPPVGQSLYDVPQFFSTIYDEQHPDCVGIPSASNLSYYNADRGELCTNMVFKDKKHLIAAVKDFSVRIARREYEVVESTKTLWKVSCKNKHSNINCRWGLRASLKSKLRYFKITKYGGPHTCMSSQVGLDHHNLDKNMIAKTLVGIVRCDPSYEIKYVIQLVKDRYNYQISYGKAWYSLKRAVENVYGTWESSVRLLPRYMGDLVKYNPDTIVEWNHLPRYNSQLKVLNYVFWAFRPCIDGFAHCRKIISVDGTHLYTKYKHKMLIAVGLDGNNQILPLAFAIVEINIYFDNIKKLR
ncbi:uncharacterized protein [Primulina eburnea]|uniref:uncharacterized protein n=1 Tax=Primulina eburnea TaxID=1245227 RepID=UPI003C6C5858